MPTGNPSNADPRRLALLLGLPASPRDWDEDELAALLRLQLSTPISPSSSQAAASHAATPPRRFRDVFDDPRPAPALLEQIKESAKAARAAPDSPLPEPVVTVLYFASISAALARCSRRITSLENSVLQDGIRWSLGRRWLDPVLRPVLEEAEALLGGSPESKPAPDAGPTGATDEG